MRIKQKNSRIARLTGLVILMLLSLSASAFAQGSIFGTVSNSNLTTPANGEVTFFGFLDDTDEEIRIETCDGAGYDAGNWFDDFQNYLTEGPGNPYDYYFYNVANGEGYHLSNLIPANSFQQENISLAPNSWPARPAGLVGLAYSPTGVLLRWTAQAGITYHIYRRLTASNGSLFRIDQVAGNLANPGVSANYFVDATVDGVNSYDYMIIAQDAAGNFSAHSTVVTVNSAVLVAPVLDSIRPNGGSIVGGLLVNVYGSNFDPNGLTVRFGTSTPVSGTVISPFFATVTTPSGVAGPADVSVTNNASALSSNVLTGGFVYDANTPPVLAAIGPKTVTEGQLLSFVTTAADAEGTTPVLTSSALPGTATYVDNGNGSGAFSWQTNFLSSGNYPVTFYATDAVDPLLVDSEVVAITVTEAGNQAPIIAPIANQSVAEGSNLNFIVSAADPEGAVPMLAAIDLPLNATFADNGNGTGTFDFNPSFAQAGAYTVTFIASDGALADSLAVIVTVNDAGNQTPVLAFIPDTSVTEGQILNFNVSASDADATTPILSAVNVPTNATFTNNGDGTGTFSFNPSFTQAGPYVVTFIASDGVLADSQVVTITVNEAGNQMPILAAVTNQLVTEGANLNFGISATDPDGTTPALSAVDVPLNATFTDNGGGSGTFDFNPDFAQAGVYTVTFIASDGTLADSQAVTITVNDAGNQAPILAAITNQTVTEGANLIFSVSATDPDATIPALSAVGVPLNATFTDSGNGSGTFDFNPSFTQEGSYTVTFIASDGVLADSQAVTVTVTGSNRAPILAPIADTAVVEGHNLTFAVTASDPDISTPLLSAQDVPTNASFADNGDGTGTFIFNPDFTQAGPYAVTFIASDGLLADSQSVLITVNEAGNQRPVLDSVLNASVPEGGNLNFVVTASDPDGTIPALSAIDLPLNATFVNNLDGTGTFDFTPDLTQEGIYAVTFIATDGALADSQVAQITVNGTNQPPVFVIVNDTTITEGDSLVINLSASDFDGNTIALTATNVPVNATFTDNGSGIGQFIFKPGYTQSGAYPVTFIASDGLAADTMNVLITVNEAGNQPPLLTAFADTSIVEGDTLSKVISAVDPEGLALTLTALGLPANATLVDSGNGAASFVYTPDFNQAGAFTVTFIASDGSLSDTAIVNITVIDAGNVPPVFAAIPDTSVSEGGTLVISVSATDPDGAPTEFPILSVSTTLLDYDFVDNGDGSGIFTYTPTYIDAGVDTVSFLATDYGTPQRTGIENVRVVTVDVNRPPQFDSLGMVGVTLGESLTFDVAATDSTDPNLSHVLLLSVPNKPLNLNFVDNRNNTGTVTFTPDSSQIGGITVTFLAVDQGTPPLSTTIDVFIDVVVQNAPALISADSIVHQQIVTEGQTLAYGVVATDPEGITPVLSARNLPENSSFTDNGNGTGVFTFSPDFTQGDSLGAAKLYYVEFRAYDGFRITKMNVIFQVNDAGNQVPVFDSIPSAIVTEGQTVTVTVTAYDPDGASITLSAVSPPAGVVFTDLGGGMATIQFTPDFTMAPQTINIQVVASDGRSQDTIVVPIVVEDAGPQPPTLNPISDQTVMELKALTFNVTTADADAVPGEYPHLTTSTLPGTATFTDNANGTGSFAWTPSITSAGTYPVWFYATDAISPALVDSQSMLITVSDTNTLPHGIISYTVYPPTDFGDPPPAIYEGDSVIFFWQGQDEDGTVPSMGATIQAYYDLNKDTLNPNMVVVDSLNGKGVFKFKPDYAQGSALGTTYNIQFFLRDATDPALRVKFPLSNVPFKVLNTNAPPTMSFSKGTGPFTIAEGVLLQFRVTGLDLIDNQAVTLSAFNLPANATFAGTTASVKDFRFTPSYTQAGNYQVGFVATDIVGLADTQLVDIIVTEAGNQNPIWLTVLESPISVPKSTGVTIPLNSTDPDNDAITLSVSRDLTDGTLTDNGNGTGTYVFTAATTLAGSSFLLSFYATDPAGASDTIMTMLQVVAFLRGDLDQNNKYTVNDLAELIAFVYRQGSEPQIYESGDVNGDSSVNLADIAYLIRFLYHGGPPPPPQ